jgi:hypothetical protein
MSDQSISPIPAKRKRGGQPGNANALRHGFYSKYYTGAEMQSLDDHIAGELYAEMALVLQITAQMIALIKTLNRKESPHV